MMALVVIAALVGTVWGLVLLRRMALVHAALAVILLGACFGYGFLTFDMAGAHWTLDRLALPLLVAMFAFQRLQGRARPAPLRREDWLLVGFLGWLTLSTFSHDYHVVFSESASPLWRLSTAYLIPGMLYWIVRQSELGESQLRLTHAALILFGLYLGFTGICEVTQQWALVVPRFIADPSLGIHFGRARGPLLTSVSYGLYLGVSLVCLLAARHCLGGAKWLVVLAALPLDLAGIFFSYTRSVWMGAGLGTLVVLGLTLHGRVRTVVLGSLASLALLVGVAKFDSILSFQREYSAAAVRESVDMRLSFSYVSWQMLRDHPLLGVGFGQFPLAKLPYLADRSTELNLETIRAFVHHNTFLSLLVETGAIGLGLFLGLLFFWGRSAWALCRDALTPPWARAHAVLFLGTLGLYACQLASHELSYSTLDNTLIFVLAGMTVGLRNAADARLAQPVVVLARTAVAVSPAPVRTQLTTH